MQPIGMKEKSVTDMDHLSHGSNVGINTQALKYDKYVKISCGKYGHYEWADGEFQWRNGNYKKEQTVIPEWKNKLSEMSLFVRLKNNLNTREKVSVTVKIYK